MKVNVSQLQAGFTKYLDAEFLQKLTGVQKWIFGATAAMALGNFGSIYNKLKANPMVIMLDVIDENEYVDIDKLYRYFKAFLDSLCLLLLLFWGDDFSHCTLHGS